MLVFWFEKPFRIIFPYTQARNGYGVEYSAIYIASNKVRYSVWEIDVASGKGRGDMFQWSQ